MAPIDTKFLDYTQCYRLFPTHFSFGIAKRWVWWIFILPCLDGGTTRLCVYTVRPTQYESRRVTMANNSSDGIRIDLSPGVFLSSITSLMCACGLAEPRCTSLP